MSDDRAYIERLSVAFDNEMAGPPTERETLRRSPPEEGVPEELDVFFYRIDEVPPDGVTVVTTVGLSNRPMEGPHARVELGYEFLGACEESDRRPLARAFAHLGTALLLDRQPIYPGLTLENLDLPPFGSMSHGVVSHWEILYERFVAGSDPPVTLYRIIPLFESEGRYIQDGEALRRLSELRAKGMNYEDQGREPVV